MKLTWHGHSAFTVEAEGAKILIDPFFTGNPGATEKWEDISAGVTHVLITHGHSDHIGDAPAILKQTGAQLVANFEICMYLVSQGQDANRINPGNTGGTVDCGAFTTTFVQAIHSSSIGADGAGAVYLGNPQGLILHFPTEKTLYHMGDTDIFTDMGLIQELHQPEIGIVPIGDRFTMGGAVAALACRRFFRFETVVPAHYASFGMIDGSAGKFTEGMQGSQTRVLVPAVGQAEIL